jgi:Tfp pilus assembly protein FimT
MIMRTALREDGFTLTELLFSTAITLVVLGTAMSTFQNALTLNETATLISDSNQNLRAGTNALVRDLTQAGRGIPTGGISIPSGAGATPLNRPSPQGQAYQFDNVLSASLSAIITGSGLGPTTAGEATDMITFLAADPRSYVLYQPTAIPDDLVLGANPLGPVGTFPPGLLSPAPTLSADGQTITVTPQFATWISDPINGIKAGQLLMFQAVSGATTIQTVTATTATTVTCQPGNPTDWFNFNQPGAAAGSILALRDLQPDGTFAFTSQITVTRVAMVTYYVDDTVAATPRLVRRENNFQAQALAGVVEDLEITYDLVDGVVNPVQIPELPYTTLVAPIMTFTANQIRKVNVHMGVRSEEFSTLYKDYMRHHISTTVSIRNLAYVDKYE